MNVEVVEAALRLGIRFQPFSHWPMAWHAIVMQVVEEAGRLGIRSLYVKEKLGGLRVQGGGASLRDAVDRAMRQADRTCVTCGGGCDKPQVPHYPRCADCSGSRVDSRIEWIEP